MSRATVASHLTAIAVCLMVSDVVPTSGGAEAAPYETFGSYVSNAEIDSMVVVVELRDVAAIEFDLDVATTKRAAAEWRQEAARIFQSRAVTTIKIKDADLSALEAMIDQAKVEKDDARKHEFESKRTLAKVERELLKQRERLRQRDIGFAKAEVEYQEAQMKAYRLELDLARTREQRTSVEGHISSQGRLEAAWQHDQKVRKMEGETLDAQRDAAGKQKKLAEAAVEISRARKNVWEAQQKLIESAGPVDTSSSRDGAARDPSQGRRMT